MSVDAAWFDHARFGMFIHFNHSSGRGWDLSWPLVGVPNLPGATEPIGVERYYASVDQFDPEMGCATDWASAARRAGMGYAVFTTKHHDGVCNFPSGRPSRMISGGRDLVGEFVTACRAEGLAVGLYFSSSDWGQADYPAWRDDMAPYTFMGYPRPDEATWDRYWHHMADQLTQLLSDYGTIDYLWFDGGWERGPDEWRSREIEELVRRLQPQILINDRLPGLAADVTTPEQLIPAEPPAGRWEACMTMNRSWGWVPSDDRYKSARDIVTTLCEVAARGGNLLLNVSPDGDGQIPAVQQQRLDGVARWMDLHGEAIVGTEPGLEPWQFHGPSTRVGDRVFLCCPWRPYERITVRGVRTRRISGVRALGTAIELAHSERLSAIDEVFGGDPVGELVIEVPDCACDELLTVIELTGA